jgi:predicted aspartyl protease
MSSLKKTYLKKGYQCIPFETTTTNHLVLKLKLNGKKGRFLLDTGASNSCIDFEAVSYFSVKKMASDIKAAGAGGRGMKTEKSLGNALQIGRWIDDNIDLVIFDLSHVNKALVEHGAKKIKGILGSDVLIKANAVIDYRKNFLFLK